MELKSLYIQKIRNNYILCGYTKHSRQLDSLLFSMILNIKLNEYNNIMEKQFNADTEHNVVKFNNYENAQKALHWVKQTYDNEVLISKLTGGIINE